MNYDISSERNPSLDLCERLVGYLSKDDLVSTPEGFNAGSRDQWAYAEAAASKERTNLHSFGFENAQDRADLERAAREAADDHLGGECLIAVHHSNPGNSHLHIGEAGTAAETEMGPDAIRDFRGAVCDHFETETITDRA